MLRVVLSLHLGKVGVREADDEREAARGRVTGVMHQRKYALAGRGGAHANVGDGSQHRPRRRQAICGAVMHARDAAGQGVTVVSAQTVYRDKRPSGTTNHLRIQTNKESMSTVVEELFVGRGANP